MKFIAVKIIFLNPAELFVGLLFTHLREATCVQSMQSLSSSPHPFHLRNPSLKKIQFFKFSYEYSQRYGKIFKTSSQAKD